MEKLFGRLLHFFEKMSDDGRALVGYVIILALMWALSRVLTNAAQ